MFKILLQLQPMNFDYIFTVKTVAKKSEYNTEKKKQCITYILYHYKYIFYEIVVSMCYGQPNYFCRGRDLVET